MTVDPAIVPSGLGVLVLSPGPAACCSRLTADRTTTTILQDASQVSASQPDR